MPSAQGVRTALVLGAVLATLAAGFSGVTTRLVARPAPSSASGVAVTAKGEAEPRLPVRFEVNRGQAGAGAKFVSRGSDVSLALGTGAIAVALPGPTVDGERAPGEVVRMRLAGSNPKAEVEGEEPLPGLSNYFRGADPAKWVTGVQSYAKVRYEKVYPGIDLVVYGDAQQRLEYDFVVAPGADPAAIGLAFSGAREVEVAGNGDLVVATKSGELRQQRPIVYQDIGGARRPVEGQFTVTNDRAGFEIGSYDPTRPLVIDPVITYSSYIGGDGNDLPNSVASDPSGAVYVTGSTTSVDFPMPEGDFADEKCGNDGDCDTDPNNPVNPVVDPIPDAFVIKIGAEGTPVYSTYLGGSGDDRSLSIAVDSGGNAYVAGVTDSPDFPTSASAFDRTCGTDGRCNEDDFPNLTRRKPDGFMTKLNPTGTAVTYSTYIGGSNDDTGRSDGATYDPRPDNPNEPGQERPTGSGVQTVEEQFTGPNPGPAVAVAADGSGNAYVTGVTLSTDLPTTAGAFDRTCGTDGSCNKTAVRWIGLGNSGFVNYWRLHPDAFVMKVNTGAAGPASLAYSTYLGGGGGDGATAIAVGTDETSSSPHAFVTGFSYSPPTPAASAFPTTASAFQPVRPAGSNLHESNALTNYAAGRAVNVPFLTRINPSGGAPLAYSTFFGGGADAGRGAAIAVAGGEAFVAGFTASASLPVSGAGGATPFQGQRGQRAGDNRIFSDGFVARIDTKRSGAASRFYATYLGGEDVDRARAISVDDRGRAHVVGSTLSSNFPLEPRDAPLIGPDSPSCGYPADPGSTEAGSPEGCWNGFAAVLEPNGSALDYSTYLRSQKTRDEHAAGVTVVPPTGGADAWIVGSTYAPDFPTVNAHQPQTAGLIDGFVTRISTTAEGPHILSVSPSRGNGGGGTRVTVRGTGFAGASRVDFGVSPGTGLVVSEDGTEITALSPPGTGTVDIRVTTPFGTSSVNSAARFTYENGTWAGRRAGTIRYGHTATMLMPQACVDGTANTDYPCGKIFVLGGDGDPTARASGELYDPLTDTWSAVARPVARSHPFGHTATLLDGPECAAPENRPAHCGTVLVVGAGGQAQEPIERAASVYSPQTNQWRVVAIPARPRVHHTATLLTGPGCGPHCGKVLVVGGVESRDEAPSTAELYDPTANIWVPTGPPQDQRLRLHTATLVQGSNCSPNCGKVLVVGGASPGGAPLGTDSAELYDPAAGRFTDRREGLVPRYSHTATSLPSGSIVIAGGIHGVGGRDNPSSVVEVFDPAKPFSEAFTETAALLTARAGHAATVLPDGRTVLLGGGGVSPHRDAPRPPLNSVETFGLLGDAGTAAWLNAAPMVQTRGFGRSRGGHTATVLAGPRCGDDCGKVFVFGGVSGDDPASSQFGWPLPGASSTNKVYLNSSELFEPGPYVSSVTPPTGSPLGGETVVITGSGFSAEKMTSASSVTFGGVPAVSFQVESSTRITAVTPPAAGFSIADVQVAVPGSGAAAFPFDYFEPVDAVTDLVAEVLSGTQVRLSFTAAGFPTATEYVLKQSRQPITAANFDAALSLCEKDVCTFPNRDYREKISLPVTGLVPETRYFYAIKAKDLTGALTGISNVASAVTANVAPAAITDLVAVADGESEAVLTFSAPGSNAVDPPPARRFVAKQSLAPITADNFDNATSLCDGGVCGPFGPEQVGARLTLRVTGLERDVTYHYAIRALDDAGNLGPVSNSVSVTLACRPAADPGAGQVRYGAGYNLVGGPQGTRFPSITPLFGWFDLGKGGVYSSREAAQPVKAGHGHWAYFPCPRTVDLGAGGPTTVEMPLGELRASMVGNPSRGQATVSGHDFTARWDPAMNGGAGGYRISAYREQQSLAPGEGIWAFSYVPTTITVAGTAP